jgi:hypothetical protein
MSLRHHFRGMYGSNYQALDGQRGRIERPHLLQHWDESTGLALPEGTVWRLIERPVGPHGMVL